jgi:hypothetical protein
MHRELKIMKNPSLIAVVLSISLAITVHVKARAYQGPVFDGSELDYQPSLIRIEPEGILMVVFERIDLQSFFGDFYTTFSLDNGSTWLPPRPAIDTPLNERHPSLVQLSDTLLALFYLVDEDGFGSYRIHRATSTDGYEWTDHGAIDLGWSAPGEINPCVIKELNGSMTMTYHRLYGPGYIARSDDDGVTWDTLKTRVSDGNGALPRLTKREWDGLYLVTYQAGSSDLDIFAKVSTDPYDWTGAAYPLSTDINSHDSQPVVLQGGTFLVTYARQVASVFDVFYTTSYDGIRWSDEVRVTNDASHYDTQPHPLPHGNPGSIILSWSHQDSPDPYVDHDVWIDAELSVPLPLWATSDSLSKSEGGTVYFHLDAGTANAGRRYFLLGSMTGTSPGTELPGGAMIPLNRDRFSDYILLQHNNAVFVDFRGTLDDSGKATATLNARDPLPFKTGTVLHFAFTTEFPFDFQSNPAGIEVRP